MDFEAFPPFRGAKLRIILLFLPSVCKKNLHRARNFKLFCTFAAETAPFTTKIINKNNTPATARKNRLYRLFARGRLLPGDAGSCK